MKSCFSSMFPSFVRISLVGVLWVWVALLSAPLLAAPGDILARFDAAGQSPSGLGWDGTNVWVANLRTGEGGEDQMFLHDPATGAVQPWFEMPAGNFYHGLAFDLDGNLFTDDGYFDIVKLSPQGVELDRFDAHGATYGVAIDPLTGKLYQVDWMSMDLHIMEVDGTLLATVALDLPEGEAMVGGAAWDGQALWLVGSYTDTIYRVDTTSGEVLSSFAAPGSGTEGITFDGSCLWISDTRTDEIFRIDHGETELAPCVAGVIEDPIDEEPTDEEPTDEEPTDEPTEEEPNDEPTDEEPTDEPTDEEPTDEEPTDGDPTEQDTPIDPDYDGTDTTSTDKGGVDPGADASDELGGDGPTGVPLPTGPTPATPPASEPTTTTVGSGNSGCAVANASSGRLEPIVIMIIGLIAIGSTVRRRR